MSELPERDDIRALLEAKPTDYGTALAAWIELQIMLKDELLGQWLDGRLKSRDEMNEEAALFANHPTATITEILNAAWEVADE